MNTKHEQYFRLAVWL